ncbi:MAG: hypothetical protein OXK79_01160, partial [Chloroflexota bacterium]|nr:hypothetical protein [Chloroflexota bacterium]
FPADRDLLTEHFGPKLDSSRGPVPARKGAPAQAEKPVVIRRVGPLQLVLRERAVRSSRRP